MPGDQHIPGTPPLSGETSARRDARAEHGFVLLVVLWWLALLMFLTTRLAVATHTAALISANTRGSAVAEAQADGAVNEALFRTLAGQWTADGTTRVVPGKLGVSRVRIDDEGGKVDPNVAPVVLMQALLRVCGAEPDMAAGLAVSISDWRSLDRTRQGIGNIAAKYRLAKRNYIPPHKRFVSIDELGLVLGMTPQLLTCLAPHISVHSLSVPSMRTADPLVRRALVIAYPEDAPDLAAATVYDAAVIRITATAQSGTSRFQRVAVIRIVPAEPDADFRYKVLSWQ